MSDGDYGLYQEAQAYADKVAPRPQYDPVTAGLVAAFGSGIIVTVFSALAGLSANAFPMAGVLTVGISFGAVWYYFKRQADENARACSAEYIRLRGEKPPV